MRTTTKRLGLILNILYCTHLSSISIVYNFRIAQITKRPIFDNPHPNHYTVISLLFDQYQKKYNGISQNFAGMLGAFIYDLKPYYFRTDFAFAGIQEKCCKKTTFSQTESDDVLFTMGRNFIIDRQSVITVSGLLGVPTHKVLRLQHVDFGYGQFGTGVQLDSSYKMNEHSSFFGGTRYIYFFKRSAQDSACNNYIFSIGNVADVLVAYQHHWPKHGLELGFTERWQFGATVCPNFDDIVNKTNYARSNFYAVYKYKFKIGEVSNRLLFNIAYSFDNASQPFNNKNVVTIWGSWNVNF